jgi:hypothetical protein
MSHTIDTRPSGPTRRAWIALATALIAMTATACEKVDCKNIATTGCAGSTLYDVYARPPHD